MRHTTIFGGIAALALLAACQQAETPERTQARMAQESSMFRERVGGLAVSWERWNAAGQADSIASVFTAEGRMMQPNGPTLVGRDAIRANQAQLFAMGQWTVDLNLESAMSNGPLGIDRGRYQLSFARGPNAPPEAAMIPPVDSGKYLVHWHQVNGTWMIADLIWNSDLPMPAPTPARRR
ncbi:MAG TPA: nuclear transport factor 2 family protein [Gemmatimonadales bacterium]